VCHKDGRAPDEINEPIMRRILFNFDDNIIEFRQSDLTCTCCNINKYIT
jgi:hypothetical protein